MLTHDEFSALAAQGFTRIPIVREVFSDLDTPLSVYLKLADGPHTYLFEAARTGAVTRSSVCRRKPPTPCAGIV